MTSHYPLGDEYYLEFENTFRGSRAEIIQRLKIYEPLLNAMQELVLPQLPGIDIGCGRGEWIELCTDNHIKIIGVDISSSMVQFCAQQGWTAVEGDGKSYLESQPDRSCSIISLFHVIEHVDRLYLLELAAQALRVLAPSGVLLMETPSSDNLLVSSKGFYADPTHLRPIHPETTCFDLIHIGYSWARSYYINGDSSYRESLPFGITRMLAGTARDVAIIAQKPGTTGQLPPEGSWSEMLRETETTLLAAIRTDSELSQRLLQLEDRCNRLEAMAQQGLTLADLAVGSAESAHKRIDAMYNSRIWKATSPLRSIATSLRRKKEMVKRFISGSKKV
jgi:O-antigen chain-terminating methyltransferase